MTPKTSLVTVVAVALVAVPAAWGKGQPTTASPDAFERAAAAQHQSTLIVSPDVVDRAVAAKLASQSVPQFNPRAVLASDSVESAREQAVAWQRFNLRDVLPSDSVESAISARERSDASQPFNLRDVVASDSVESTLGIERNADRRLVGDNYREVPKPVSRPTSIAAADSGRDIEWPQIGMGFGLGILLALGLFLAMRYTRMRPLAH